MIQLRDKTASPAEFFESAVEVIDYARPLGVKIVINDRADIALATGADGVHLGQDDLPPRKARELLGGEAIIGFSTHTLDQAVEALELPVDYIAFGPIFPTGTKENPDAVVGLENLKDVRRTLKAKPLVAIGGITAENVASVIAAGANSAAVISDIVQNGQNITQKLRRLAEIAI